MVRRSLLFVPGNNERMIQKALSKEIQADCIILDLEDSVPPNEKERARSIVASVLAGYRRLKRQIYIRINQLDSVFFKNDIKFIVNQDKIDGIVLPKAEEDVGLVYKETGKKVIPIIETARGLIKMQEIAKSKGVIALTFGSADLALSLGGSVEYYDKNTMIRTLIIIVARAYGLDPIDKVCFNVSNLDVLRTEAIEAKSMGFSGKLAVHPSQINIINEIFSPTNDEVNWAKKVLDIYEQTTIQKKGAVKLNGQLIDAVHYKLAKRILDSAGIK
jgi:citrate lyase subunit beta/citryl-CoA lyase